MTGHCNNWPDEDRIFQKSNCSGVVIAIHSVWTDMQCLDNCLRHPQCDKYIFNGQGDQNCKLLTTVDITGVVNLPNMSGACAPNNTEVSVKQTLAKQYLLNSARFSATSLVGSYHFFEKTRRFI